LRQGSLTSSLADRIEQSKKALKAPELARMLSVSNMHIYRLAKSGRIPYLQIGDRKLFDPKATAQWLRSQLITG